jgi:hypothetical protein
MGEVTVQPLGHALGLALAFARQRALQVVFADIGFFGFGMAPEDEVHGFGS